MSYTEEAAMDALHKENERLKEENRVLMVQRDELCKMVSSLAKILDTYNM